MNRQFKKKCEQSCFGRELLTSRPTILSYLDAPIPESMEGTHFCFDTVEA